MWRLSGLFFALVNGLGRGLSESVSSAEKENVGCAAAGGGESLGGSNVAERCKSMSWMPCASAFSSKLIQVGSSSG